MSFNSRALLLSLVALLASCTQAEGDNPPKARLAGQLIAGTPVEGVTYGGSAPKQTLVTGGFTYTAGTAVRFRIGDIALGQPSGAPVLTPVELAQASGPADREAANIARLLQTLDSDCDISNGITISAAARTAGAGRTGAAAIDFDQPVDSFASDPAVTDFLSDAGAGCPTVSAPAATESMQAEAAYRESHGGRPNQRPTAVASASPTQPDEGATVTLIGTQSSDADGQIVSYEWTQTVGPAVTLQPVSGNAANRTFTAPQVGANTSLRFRLRVRDDANASHNADVTVTVQNTVSNAAPSADAGADQTVREGSAVALDGRASSDPEGQALSYQWTQSGGPAVSLTGATTSQPGFTAPAVTGDDVVLQFTLVVRDPQGRASAADTVQVTVKDSTAPTADAGADQSVDEGVTVTLSGAGSDDGSITAYAWTQIAGPDVTLTGADTATATFTAPDVSGDQVLGFRLTVTDDDAKTGSDDMTVTVSDLSTLSVGSVAVTEGDSGTTPAVFAVTLSAAQPVDVTAQWATADDSATAPADYAAASGTVTVPAGQTTASITVQVSGDTQIEADETFKVTLSDVQNAGAGALTGIGTITTDDAIPANLLKVGAAKRSVTPTDAQVAGQVESYAGGSRTQFFHLGGFGFGPFKVVPSYGDATPPVAIGEPVGPIPGISNPPVKARCFSPSITTEAPTPASCEDDTWVRVMVISPPDAAPGDGARRVAFVTLDAVGAGNLIQDAVKAAVSAATCAEGACVAFENVLFGQTHSHAGADLQGLWGGVPREWIDAALVQGAAAAAVEAVRGAKQANLVMARGLDERYNNYRRPRYRADAALHEADTTLTVLKAEAADGSGTLGTILQYAAHPTAIGDEDFCTRRQDTDGDGDLDCTNSVRVPHADYPIGAQYDLENAFGGTALYFNGPIADASASGGPGGVNQYDSVRRRGAALAQSARQLLAQNPTTLDPVLAIRSTEVTLPITNPAFLALGVAGAFNGYYQFTQVPFGEIEGIDQIPPEVIAQFEDVQNQAPQPTPVARTLVSRISLGSIDAADAAKNRLEIVTIPGEATNTFGQYIRGIAGESAASEARPEVHTMLLGLTHNSFGYIIPEEEFSYFDPSGDAGFVAPYTGYEEFVSMGPLTAPLLRIQGYNMLFDASPEQNLPPALTDCTTATDYRACIAGVLQDRLAQIAAGASSITGPIADGFESIAEGCVEVGFPAEFCAVFQTIADTLGGVAVPPGGGSGGGDADLLFPALDAQARGCDLLDPSNCLYPFPNDWFTADAAAGSIQHQDNDGTGRRVNINPLATPRNSAGKPVDPTEWNRSDGFSPGALIATFVPGLSLEQTFGKPAHQIGLADLAAFQHPDSPILVLEVGEGAPARHLVWAELDANANQLTVAGIPNVGTFPIEGVTDDKAHVARPQGDGKAALLIRPAKNFREGTRYVVVLRNLKDAAGNAIPAGAGFRACVSGESALPPVQARCEQLEEKVFPVLAAADIDPAGVYLAWDFTVLSTNSAIGRLRHMRDESFKTLSADAAAEDCTQLTAENADDCAPPQVAITRVARHDDADLIEGYLTVPNFLAPVGPSPLEDPRISAVLGDPNAVAAMDAFCSSVPRFEDEDDPFHDGDQITKEIQGGCEGWRDALDLAQGAAMPNRLFYSPADGAPSPDPTNLTDPAGVRYGDGLPDQNGTMTPRFFCRIPDSASPDRPARASLYGHGQLDRGIAITYEGTPEVAREHNFMFCAVDWFGFRTGDAVNVVSSLVDLSNFPVIPDASQQGMVNFMFLARAMKHPQGFAALPEFQKARADGKHAPVFDRSEVYYNGNSQGGIFGGVVLAASKDVNRGVLGSLGMNYSTLLTRSKNFDEYAGLLYNSYTDPLDRQLLFSMMQMLWDRSENDGYASHIVDNSAFGGPANQASLDTMFGDPQVTMFSAEVMARTMGIPYDARQVDAAAARNAPLGPNGTRHPAVQPYYGLLPMQYVAGEGTSGSALVVWDTAENESAQTNFAHVPPTNNTPPRTGPDRHDASQKRRFGRCHIAHFLSRGKIIDVLPHQYGGQACAPIADPAPTAPVGDGGGEEPSEDPLDLLLSALTGGDFVGALAVVQNAITDAFNGALTQVATAIGDAIGIGLPAPGHDAAPTPHQPARLMAGVAKKPIWVPVGTPLGGYLRPPVGGDYLPGAEAMAEGDPNVLLGELADFVPSIPTDGCDPTAPDTCLPNAPLPDELRKVHSPYATYSPPSRGYYDSLVAKAVALYDGRDYVVLVKTDFIGMLDELVQDVKAEVKERTGKDLGDGLIMSATHSHDGPGAVANHSTRYFWLAMDAYQHDVYVRVVDQLADVVVAALDNMQEARIGHASGSDSATLNKFRRGRLDTYDDNDTDELGADYERAQYNDAEELRRRIGVLRVDAADGTPLAVVINYALHGIAFDVENQFFSGDVLGAIERETEQSFAAADLPAGAAPPIAMLVQSVGGDVTPTNVPYSIQGIEMMGKRMAPQVRAVYDAIDTPAEFQTSPDLRAVSQRVILSREKLGYTGDEYPYPWGGGQCGNNIEVPFAGVGVSDIPEYDQTGGPTKNPFCIPSPPPDAADLADNGVGENGSFYPQDTILTAAKIGDITLLVQPGEPLVEYGVRLLELANREGLHPSDTFVWGYAGDHIGYILPPEETDWATFGGAESTTTFWGWKQGARFLDVNRELIRALRDSAAPPADEFQVDYSKYRAIYDAKPAHPATPSVLPGSVVAQPADIRRFGETVFTFEGGDPVVDLPAVQMQRRVDGAWQPVRRANGEVMDTFFEMHLKYRLVSGRHLWTVQFEAPKDWVAGEYRFAVAGTAFQGGNAGYTAESTDFTVDAVQNLSLTNLACDAAGCSAKLNYQPVPSNYRVVDAFVNNDQAAPVRGGLVSFTNGTVTRSDTDADGDGVYQVGPIAGTVSAGGRDDFGNTTPGQPAPADTDGDGIDDAVDNCDATVNPGQEDTDGDGIGDACDTAEPPAQGFPVELCEPVSGDDYCLEDIPVLGPAVQDALDTAWNTVMGGGGSEPPPPPVESASCATGRKLEGGRSYQVVLTAADGARNSFQVLEPVQFDCANAARGAHPLILHGHGFGGSRNTSATSYRDNYRENGYTVISIDQRGFGDSTGTVRVMDPDAEGRNIVQILDWAEANLDYLAYRDELAPNRPFVARPAGGSTGSANLLVGAQGGSYGGGYQFMLHNVDAKDRVDVMAPDITWHDLRYSLNPGDVVKSGFDLLLSAGGARGTYAPALENGDRPDERGLDPYIVEALARGAATNEFPAEALEWFRYHSPTYWCGLNGEPTMPYGERDALADPNLMLTGAAGDVPGANTRTGQPGVDMVISQGFRDTLFNFNDAWYNYQCARARGGDVRLITHQSGHILNLGSLGVPVPAGTPLDIQAPGQSDSCGNLSKYSAALGFFNQKLRGQGTASSLSRTEGNKVCLSLAEGDAVYVPEDKVLAPRAPQFTALTANYTAFDDVTASTVPQGLLAQNLFLSGAQGPTAIPLFEVTAAEGAILAGIATANLRLSTPQMVNDAACEMGSVPTVRTGCDAIVFLGLGVKSPADADWRLADDQLTPVRGLGTHATVEFAGSAERLKTGDQVALLVYGYHPQYLGSYSRDATIQAVNVVADLKLPLYAATGSAANAAPDFLTPAADSIDPIGGGEPEPEPAGDAQGLAGCALTQDPALCQDAIASLPGLSECSFDESGINCAYLTAYDAIGAGTAAATLREVIAQCYANPTAPVCEAVRNTGGAPDRVIVASEPVARGNLVYTEQAPVGAAGVSAKTVDGSADDWMGQPTLIGGTDVFEYGEHIYTDFLFDAFGADGGEDARRLAALGLLGDVSTRTDRIDALQQAGGDQLGVPRPAGSAADHYGDRANREDGTDLTEVRWAASGSQLFFLARVAKLENPASLRVLILADTGAASGMSGVDAGLRTAIFDTAVLLENGAVSAIDLATGAPRAAAGAQTATQATGYVNALEARLPASLLQRADGTIRVAVMTVKRDGAALVPANVAYRYDEPVTIYSERAQAMALFAGSVDAFARTIAVPQLAAGRTQTAVPGPGYHERQFISGSNISVEGDAENGRLQPYGVYVPTGYASAPARNRLTFWTHYRGGKAHSGAAWTPRLIHQLGEEQHNLVVSPRARGTSTWYTTRAHQDFFEVFADAAGSGLLGAYAAENLHPSASFPASGLFSVDPAHVYISGYSMGGFATYLFSGLYPDLFAAGYSTSGAVTQGAWTGLGPDPADPGYALCAMAAPDDVPEIGGGTPCFIEANSGRADAQLNYRILENTLHVPLVIHHGTNDELALTPGAERMGARLLELQYRYDMTTFLGYEHFTQAIVDEWADGARFLNLYARPENPRTVTYKLVPALVKAVNEVQLNGLNGGQPFDFHPDGAYWVDGLAVRTTASPAQPHEFGRIDATSLAIAGMDHVAVPRTGAYADTANPANTYVSTPVYSPGNHSTPYVRHGLEWLDTTAAAESNGFTATLANLSAATLDLKRMKLSFAAPATGTVTTDGPATLTLAGIDAPVTVCVGAAETLVQNGRAALALAGNATIRILPGAGQSCGAAPVDTDGDGVLDATDNCPAVPNADQADADSDGTGDACEAGEPPAGLPLCEPLSGENYCLSDIPLIGASLQDAVDTVYNAINGGGGGTPALPPDVALAAAAADALARGCDILDPSHCLFPFPNDHFTVPAAAGSPQSVEQGGTGRRIAFNVAGMPRNIAGKPIDPSEWNRNDGFSPGQMILAYVPELGTVKDDAGNPTGPVKGAPAITDLSASLADDATVFVIDAVTGEKQLLWAEIDLNAGFLIPAQGIEQPPVREKRPALIIRPAKNLAEGRRYIVVLRQLQRDDGSVIPAGAAFAACLDADYESALPPVAERCSHLRTNVFPALADADVDLDPATLFLAWDFTVASAENNVGRLRHMRDDAFSTLGDDGALSAGQPGFPAGRAPQFTITSTTDDPQNGVSARLVKGTFTVPSYVVPADDVSLPAGAPAGQVSTPPNRLLYLPDASSATACSYEFPGQAQAAARSACIEQARYGDGLPDRNPAGTLTANFTCTIPKSALSGKLFADAAPADVKPARPSLYGHGLLGSHTEGGIGGGGGGQAPSFGNEQNIMICATDWFGFATGDLGNVATVLADVSNFPVIPDGGQQGVVNFLFLARLMSHPQGFAGHPAFRLGDTPVFDTREVFYDGNSQGGILGGPVVAMSKDVQRGVLGVPGMNYSTLLTRSVDFDLYAVPLYANYQDDLDRSFVFSLMQMLWDRSENNGYAHHITDSSALNAPDNEVLLHPAFSDHQVSMWTAEIMARTVGAAVDRSRVAGSRHPDANQYFALPAMNYADAAAKNGSALVVWDNNEQPPPPIGNVSPREGADPHSFPRNQQVGRCQKGHFLQRAGVLIAVPPRDSERGAFVCPAIVNDGAPGGEPVTPAAGGEYGPGILGAFSQFMGELNTALVALLSGDPEGTQGAIEVAAGNLVDNVSGLPSEGEDDPVTGVVGDNPADYAAREGAVNRSIEAVVITGDKLAAWSVPAAFGLPYPYPSGAVTSGEVYDQFQDNDPTGLFPIPGQVRDAHNGVMLYPQDGAPSGQAVARIAAYRHDGTRFVEIPVQVDERYPYFLANAASDFSVYSGTDEELTYAWATDGADPFNGSLNGEKWNAGGTGPDAEYPQARPDPVAGLDHDDEVVFMYRDAGAMAPALALPSDDPDFDPAGGLQEIALADPLQPGEPKYVYLGLKREGAAPRFAGQAVYVRYTRDADADQWIDRGAFCENDPEKLGTSNTGYGPNRSGNVYVDAGTCAEPFPQVARATPRNSNDRFPRDGITISTDTYRWRATGRWMVREVQIDDPTTPALDYGADLIDRWKGRAFQQSPDSVISLVGFEDEQVNWEANSTLLGERCGPVRCIREVWGADSGTNVTKTETFYRDAVASRYRVRVHPIPSDGLYTSWDYNRGAMVPTDAEKAAGVPAGRYFSALRPQGVPVDGVNDDVGQSDQFPFCRQLYDSPAGGTLFPPVATAGQALSPATEAVPFAGTTLNPYELQSCAAFFDAADPTFNLPLAFNNWEQVSGKGSLGSLVYVFEVKGATSFGNPLVVPYYRDDACLDDGTGDDPVARPFPGESYAWNGGAVPKAYNTKAGRDPNGPLVDCSQRQGAYASHGVHYFVTHDSDNAFVMGKPVTEADAQWWQIMVPTARPENRGAEHANVVRVPVQAVVMPRTAGLAAPGGGGGSADTEPGLLDLAAAFVAQVLALPAAGLDTLVASVTGVVNNLVAGLADLLASSDHASVLAVAVDVAGTPGDAPQDVTDGAGSILDGFVQEGTGRVSAGVGVVDMTPDVGYGAGQYSDANTGIAGGLAGGDIDPFLTSKKQQSSYGVMTRLTGRAIVIEGSNGKRVALLKSDNYLAQDTLVRRIGQILAEQGSSIGYDQILYGVTHAHSTSYYSGSPAVAAFQDVFDPRFFESQARKLAAAILIAERDLQPARMGATTVRHKVFKGQIMGPATGDDGTPVQYPHEYGDLGLVVMRLDNADSGEPIAVWVNWGEHPEGLDGYNLHSADYVAFLERFVGRDLAGYTADGREVPLVFSQGDVGSAEKSGNTSQQIGNDGRVCNTAGNACGAGEGVWRDWNHAGFVQNERNVRFLADAVIKGWRAIGGEPGLTGGNPRGNDYIATVQVPMSGEFPVDYRNAFVPGPLSHPYPAVSNCRSEPTTAGDVGVPVAGLPDCGREGIPGSNPINDQLLMIASTLKAEGVPVPEHYDAPSFVALEDNARLKLQAVRLGDMVLGSCACEAQVDLILNFESRANDVAGDIYDGFDWACVAEDSGQKGFSAASRDPAYAEACRVQREKYYDAAEFPIGVPGNNFAPAAIARMRAQVHNDARGWDAPDYVPYANAEPVEPALIKGNFTKEELAPQHGYKLAVGVGHAGDYNGYTVSYREYMSHDHYRKALTAYGAHTADYMVTRLVRMAGAMKGAGELAREPQDVVASTDEIRMVIQSSAIGAATNEAYEAYHAALPPDAGPHAALEQPSDIGLFNAATFTWRGGSTQVDNPVVTVERCAGAVPANCATVADQTGEVQTRVHWPQGIPGVAMTAAGQQEWRWTASVEAYEPFPSRLSSIGPGFYRFVVEGCINDGSDPAANVQGRISNLLDGLFGDVTAGVLDLTGCRGGATPYRIESETFEVQPGADVVQSVASDADGTLTVALSPTSIPRTYASGLFPYLTPANDNGRFCEECSFRPWARSNAAPVRVTLVKDGGGTVQGTGAGGTWTIESGMAQDAAGTLTVEYGDGRVSRAFRFARPAAATGGGGEEPPASGPQLCAPGQVPEIGNECLADNGGAPVQDAMDEIYGTLTGFAP